MASTTPTILEEIDLLKKELDALRPLPSDVLGRIGQKLRIEWELSLQRHRGEQPDAGRNEKPDSPRADRSGEASARSFGH